MKKILIENFHEISLLVGEEKTDVISVMPDQISFKNNRDMKVGESHNVVVRVLDKLCDISLHVNSIENKIVEAKVEGSCDIYRNFVTDYFNAEIQGMNLKEISKEQTKNAPEGEPYWFFVDSDNEIYYTAVKEKITSFQIAFSGEMICFDGNGVIIGSKWEEDSDRIKAKGSDLIKEGSKLSKNTMELLFRFIQSCQKIKSDHKKEILSIIKKRFEKDWA